MMKQLMNLTWVLGMTLFLFTVGCDKTESLTSTEIENYTDEVVFNMQRDGNCGKFGCYEFVFPIDITLPGAVDAVTVESYEELREAIKAWKEANPDSTERPSLAFPIEVVTQDGDVLSIASKAELHELRMECRRNFFERHRAKGHRHRGHLCFKLVFPVNVDFPDDGVQTAADRMELKSLIRAWKEANPDAEERPELVFPITVEMEDGTTVEVADRDALKELKDSCSAE